MYTRREHKYINIYGTQIHANTFATTSICFWPIYVFLTK